MDSVIYVRELRLSLFTVSTEYKVLSLLTLPDYTVLLKQVSDMHGTKMKEVSI